MKQSVKARKLSIPITGPISCRRPWSGRNTGSFMYTNAPIATSTTLDMAAESESIEHYKTARMVRNALLDGVVHTVGDLVTELKISRSAVESAITTLTNIEPNLAEDDNNAVFLAIGG